MIWRLEDIEVLTLAAKSNSRGYIERVYYEKIINLYPSNVISEYSICYLCTM